LGKFLITILLSFTVASLFSINELAESSAFAEFRTIDGSGNNIAQPNWGAANFPLLRMTPSDYGDGLSSPSGGDRPGAREISNAVAAQSSSIPDPNSVSDYTWVWGQFVDHDIDLTGSADPSEPFNIPVPIGDPFFDPFNTGTQEITLNRSIYTTDVSGVRQQLNQITSYIDGSNVYGSDPVRANDLRENDGTGKLRTSLSSNGEVLLPLNINGLPNAGGTGSNLYIAGDVRANEQAGLTALHTLFVREHNRIADDIAVRLAGGEPDLVQKFNDSGLSPGDFIYQAARKVVGAQIQIITYNDFLPVLLGPNALTTFSGYDTSVNSEISTEFSTAAYRIGHTMVSEELFRVGANPIPIQEAFFDPQILFDDGADSLLGGIGFGIEEKVDNKIIDGLRNFLFGPPGAGGFDLASLNTQRGRDHGIPSYNSVRMELGLPAQSFLDMTGGDGDLANEFASVYASVDDVDLWTGGLAEPPFNNGMVGETVFTILVDQFQRLRDGDRFFYLNDLSDLQIIEPDIVETSLSDLILRNTSMESMPPNVFIAQANPVGGLIIPVDTTLLLLAGVQNIASWLIPAIISAIGFAIILQRKF